VAGGVGACEGMAIPQTRRPGFVPPSSISERPDAARQLPRSNSARTCRPAHC
jgi:hypothetical protein